MAEIHRSNVPGFKKYVLRPRRWIDYLLNLPITCFSYYRLLRSGHPKYRASRLKAFKLAIDFGIAGIKLHAALMAKGDPAAWPIK